MSFSLSSELWAAKPLSVLLSVFKLVSTLLSVLLQIFKDFVQFSKKPKYFSYINGPAFIKYCNVFEIEHWNLLFKNNGQKNYIQ